MSAQTDDAGRERGLYGPMGRQRTIDEAARLGILAGPAVHALRVLVNRANWSSGLVIITMQDLALMMGSAQYRTASRALAAVLGGDHAGAVGDSAAVVRRLVALEKRGGGRGVAHVFRLDHAEFARLADRVGVRLRDSEAAAADPASGDEHCDGSGGIPSAERAQSNGKPRAERALSAGGAAGASDESARGSHGKGTDCARSAPRKGCAKRAPSRPVIQDPPKDLATAGAVERPSGEEEVLDSVRMGKKAGQAEPPEWMTDERRYTLTQVAGMLSKKHQRAIRAGGMATIAQSVDRGILTLAELDSSPADRLADRLARWAGSKGSAA